MSSSGTGIQWTEATWNPVVGCEPVSPGCLNCYAAQMAGQRLANIAGQRAVYAGLTVEREAVGKNKERQCRHVFNGVVRCLEERLAEPLSWRRPRMVFVNSMSDLFHEAVPFEFVDRVFAVMALAPRHTFQILTKRPERMAAYFLGRRNIHVYNAAAELLNGDFSRMPGDMAQTRSSGGTWWPLPNVWLGTSVEDQARADERVPKLLRCPVAVRFLSVEPLLGPVDLRLKGIDDWDGPGINNRVDWVIVGGESGKHARACDVAWVRSVVEQCGAAGVPCFVKQLGKWVTGAHDFEGWKGKIDRWLLSDGKGNTSTYHRPVLRAEYSPQFYDERPQNAIAWGFGDQKGGDISEWPPELQVREFPKGFSRGSGASMAPGSGVLASGGTR
jgi:protein gp37